MNAPIQTPRLILKPMDDRDSQMVQAILTHSAVTSTYMVPDLTPAQADTLFQRFKALSADPARFVRGIYLNEELIGFLNDTEIEGDSMELGWALHPLYHNQGYATEAVSAAISHLLAHGFTQIIAGAFEENNPSIRVMEKCGMTKMKKTDFIDYRGKNHRCVYYSLSK